MTQTTPTFELAQAGQSPWLDQISRQLLNSGRLQSLIEDYGLLGVTSNPTIFEKAISEPGGGYEADIRRFVRRGARTSEIYDALTLADIRRTCDLFLPVFKRTGGEHGFVSLEVAPGLARETEATIREAHRLFKAVGRPNVMIKVPSTPEGIPAVRKLIGDGVNINITLMFSLRHYQAVAQAYLEGLEDYLAKGGDLSRVHSVASVFVSRIDTLIDKKLGDHESLRGKAAVANSKWIYQEFKKIFFSERFAKLQSKGATIQKVLWGSTSTKNPAYADLLYVEPIVGRETVNTMPLATLEALLDHGQVRPNTVEEGLDEAAETVRQLKALAIDLNEVGDELQRQGVKAFCDSFDSLMRTLELARESLIRKKMKFASVKYFLGPLAVPPSLSLPLHPAGGGLGWGSGEGEGFTQRLLARDPKIWKQGEADPALIASRLGWLGAAEWALGKVVELDPLPDFVHLDKIKDVVLLGMGGSSLGAEVLAAVMKRPAKGPRFHVLDTTDPAAILKTEKKISFKSTLFIVASKSGSTIETLSQFRYFWGKGARRFFAVTDPGSSLEKLARMKNFQKIFLNPSDIGGRYSVLSYFGLVPAALLGIDVRTLLASARALSCEAAVKLGFALAELARTGRDKLTIWATRSLIPFGAWLEQLVAESTGKDGKGIVPVDGEGPLDPSSYGKDRAFVILRLKGDPDAGLSARIKALKKAGFPVIEFEWPDRESLGAEFFRWEIATAIAGARLDINPFDEPNVQESKDNTARILAEKRGGSHFPFKKIEPSLFPFFSKLKPGGYIALLAYTERSAEIASVLNRIRQPLAKKFRVPVLVGFGPRYLHSIGQLYKGGVPKGIFIEFLPRGKKDMSIPEADYTFGQLKRAQALGDYQALEKRSLPVLVIDLGKDPEAGLNAFERKLAAYLKSV